MLYKHPTQRNGKVSLRAGRNALVVDGVFEVPDSWTDVQHAVEARGCTRMKHRPKSVESGSEPRNEADAQHEARLERLRAIRRGAASGAHAHTPPAEQAASSDFQDLQVLAEAHGVTTNASTVKGLKKALTQAGVDWRAALEGDADAGEEDDGEDTDDGAGGEEE